MKIRKIMTTVLALTLTFSLGTTVLASEIISPGDEEGVSTNITATYQAGSETTTPTYHVDVSWGNMEFVYHGNKAIIWNPNTLQYEEKAEGAKPGWVLSAEGDNSITVKNHSNVPVQGMLSYEQETNYEGIEGKFNQNSFFLASAEETDVSAAPSTKATLTLEGELSDNVAVNTKIGAAKVTINEVQPIPVYSQPSGKPYMTLYQQDENTYVCTAKPNVQGKAFSFAFTIGEYTYYSFQRSSTIGTKLGDTFVIGSTKSQMSSVGNIFFATPLDSDKEYRLTFNIQGNSANVTVTEAMSVS